VRFLLGASLVLSALPLGACSGLYGDDELERYVQRADKVTLSAGDAKSVNATTQVLDPWPPGVNDPRIPANGDRMVRAIERYRRGPAQAGPANPVPAGAAPAAGPAAGAAALAAPAAVAVPSTAAGTETGQAPAALGSQ
jgi:hypothetical protein